MTDREAIVELTDEVERWMQQLMLERKAHEATRESLRELAAAYDQLREPMDRAEALLVCRGHLGKTWTVALCDEVETQERRAESAEAISDFWEAEAARAKECQLSYAPMRWWHAHRRTR